MNQTFTNPSNRAMEKISDFEGVLRVLRNEGVVLLPTDTVWSLGCDATDLDAVQRLLHLKASDNPWYYEILTDSVEMLKSSIRHLNPRLETLLLYHERPLSVMIEKTSLSPGYFPLEHPFLTFRIVKDDYCRTLIGEFGRPILTTAAAAEDGEVPANFSRISIDLLKDADYVVKHGQDETEPGELSVMVKLSDKDELEFLRD